MGSGLVLIGFVACWRWLWRTWRLRLCLCGISLSGQGGGFVVLLDVLYKVGCILAWDVAPFVRILQDKHNVMWVPFSFYGGMSESSRGLLAVVWESDLARGGGQVYGRWREWVIWCGRLLRSLHMLRPRYLYSILPVAASLWTLVVRRK